MLSRSVRPMLQEEAFHMLTGNTGLMRLVKAGKIPISLIQKYFDKWLSTGADLFGQDGSSSAHWAYEWGLKGRYDEHLFDDGPNMDKLNELSRSQYLKEVGAIVDSLNKNIPADQPKLRMPDEKFRRSIGEYAGKTYSVTGELLSQEAYEKHLQEVLPTDADDEFLIGMEKEKGWIVDPQTESVGFQQRWFLGRRTGISLDFARDKLACRPPLGRGRVTEVVSWLTSDTFSSA